MTKQARTAMVAFPPLWGEKYRYSSVGIYSTVYSAPGRGTPHALAVANAAPPARGSRRREFLFRSFAQIDQKFLMVICRLEKFSDAFHFQFPYICQL